MFKIFSAFPIFYIQLLFIILIGCASTPQIASQLRRDMTLYEFSNLAKTNGFTVKEKISIDNYSMFEAKKSGFRSLWAVFDPDGRLSISEVTSYMSEDTQKRFVLVAYCGFNINPREIPSDLDYVRRTCWLKKNMEKTRAELGRVKNELRILEQRVVTNSEKQEEFLNQLTDKQLKIFANYEEAVKNKSKAKKALHLRNIKKRLTEEQKNLLIELFTVDKDIITKIDILHKKALQLENLKYAQFKQLMNEMDRKTAELEDRVKIANKNLADSFQNIQDTHQRYMDNYYKSSTNSSLRDIANALRGY